MRTVKDNPKAKKSISNKVRKAIIDTLIFKKDEVVWHTNFKCKVTFCYEMQPLQGRWFKVQMDNGGFMGTQFIEKYNNQDLTK